MTTLYMEPTMETFYKSILAYAGLVENDEGDITNVDPKFGDFTIDSKGIRLPYREYLKNPEGRSFLHLLNESYTSPETAMFSLYKRRLVCELNIRLTELIMKLIRVASEPVLQKRIRSSATVELITQLGEVEMEQIEAVFKLMKASRKVNDEGFLFDIHLKKNGEINETPYAAIGKINWHAYKEIQNSLQLKDSEYKVFGTKMRKKDLLVLETMFQVIFPDIDNPQAYSCGTDFKGFRYLNALLKTSYQIAERINEIVEQLEEAKEPSLELDSARCDLKWATVLEELYGMMDKIRMIPNQNNPKSDAHHRLNLQEPKVEPAQAPVARETYQPPQPYQSQTPAQPQAVQPPQYQPSAQQQPPYPQQPPQALPQQPQAPLTPEEIIRREMQQPPMFQPPGFYPQPGYPQPPMGYQSPMQPMYPQQPMQPMYPQPQMQPMYPQPQMQPMYPQQPVFTPQYPQPAVLDPNLMPMR